MTTVRPFITRFKPFRKVFERTFGFHYWFRRKHTKDFIQGIYSGSIPKIGNALLYYKTDPFYTDAATRYAHTNSWEIIEITRILNKLGFSVDIIDRNANFEDIKIEDKYAIFIGLGAGNSGKYFARYAEQLKTAIKVFYAAGPEPELSNELILERYRDMQTRHPEIDLPPRRMITKVKIKESMHFTDAIFCIGNSFSISSYEKFKKPTFRVFPSSSPSITVDAGLLLDPRPRTFLYFGGNGHVVKGLDILVDVFRENSQLKLIICGPAEEDFEKHFRPIVDRCPNITWKGFVSVGSDDFQKITAECGFIVLPSCSEGTATSVTTCMRRGLIPVTTYQSGIDLGDWGFLIDSYDPIKLAELLKTLCEIPDAEFISRRVGTYMESQKYTQNGFSTSFEAAILSILKSKKLGGL